MQCIIRESPKQNNKTSRSSKHGFAMQPTGFPSMTRWQILGRVVEDFSNAFWHCVPWYSHKQTVFVKWLHGRCITYRRAQRVVFGGLMWDWETAWSTVPRNASEIWPGGWDWVHNLPGVADTLETRTKIQNELDKLGKCSTINWV